MFTITAIGDSIVDTVGRGSPPVNDTTQWLYKLAEALGETNIRMEPLPEYSATPNILANRWAAEPTLSDGDITNFTTLTDTERIINFSTWYSAGAQIFAVRAYTKDTEFTLRVYRSNDGVTWGTPIATYAKPAGHSEGFDFCNWWPWGTGIWNSWGQSAMLTKYLKFEILGTMTVSEVQVCANVKNDRGSCLNKIVGENYIINNVGLGSQQSGACQLRFDQDVVGIGSDVVIILAGINDISQLTLPETTQSNLIKMYDAANAAGITCIPVTLLPYNGQPARFNEIWTKTTALNSWISTTAAVRRYNLLDWYEAMEDPLLPGHMKQEYTDDDIHLNIAGNQAIIDSFDLTVFTEVTHDFYVMPLFGIPFSVNRVGVTNQINISFGNSKENSYRIYVNPTPGVTTNSTLIHETTGYGTHTYTYSKLEEGYYKCYGVNTGVWSDEIYVVAVPPPPEEPEESPTQVVTYIPSHGYTAFVEIEEQDSVLV